MIAGSVTIKARMNALTFLIGAAGAFYGEHLVLKVQNWMVAAAEQKIVILSLMKVVGSAAGKNGLEVLALKGRVQTANAHGNDPHVHPKKPYARFEDKLVF